MLSLLDKLLVTDTQPRQFLHYCFNIDQLPFKEILEEEASFSYCTQCVRSLSKILSIHIKTVLQWGNNPNFERMLSHAHDTRSYALMALSKEALNQIINTDFQTLKITAKQFIQEILLKDLSPE